MTLVYKELDTVGKQKWNQTRKPIKKKVTQAMLNKIRCLYFL